MQVLKNILSFTGLGIGVPASLPHGLNRGTGPATPRLVAANAPGFTITANTINVTVTRTTGGAAVSVYAELWHTYEDAEPYPGLALANFPFVIDANGAGGGGGSTIIVEDEGVLVVGGPFATLDFVGEGVVATDGGGGTATVTIPRTVATDGVTITGDGTTGNPLVGVQQAVTVLDPVFSTGADGVLVFDGAATVAGLVPAGGVYTMQRDLLPSQMTVQAGVRLKLDGSAIFGSEWAQIDGILDDDGNAGGTGTSGAARAARRFAGGAAGGSASGSNDGGASGEAWPALAAAAATLNGAVATIGPTATARFQGGAGGGSAGGFPGGGGAITLTVGEGRLDFETLCSGYPLAGTGTRATFGSGGGSGGSGAGARGGGGAGGGCALVAFPELRGTGRISVRGGDGGASAAGGNSGGGGGGGGGLLIAVYNTIAGTLTMSVTGGAGGAGDGTGRAGGGGAPGYSYNRPLR